MSRIVGKAQAGTLELPPEGEFCVAFSVRLCSSWAGSNFPDRIVRGLYFNFGNLCLLSRLHSVISPCPGLAPSSLLKDPASFLVEVAAFMGKLWWEDMARPAHLNCSKLKTFPNCNFSKLFKIATDFDC